MKSRVVTLAPLGKLAECPPFLAYAIAASRGLKLTDLAAKSGIPMRTFLRITQKINWDDVKMADLAAYLKACEIDPWEFWRERKYLALYRHRLPGLDQRHWKRLNELAGKIVK